MDISVPGKVDAADQFVSPPSADVAQVRTNRPDPGSYTEATKRRNQRYPNRNGEDEYAPFLTVQVSTWLDWCDGSVPENSLRLPISPS